MNRIDYQAQYLGNARDEERNRSENEGTGCQLDNSLEDRDGSIAFHRLHARLGFDLPGQSPRRRHEMEDQGYVR